MKLQKGVVIPWSKIIIMIIFRILVRILRVAVVPATVLHFGVAKLFRCVYDKSGHG